LIKLLSDGGHLATRSKSVILIARQRSAARIMRRTSASKPKGGFTADIESVAVYARDDGTGYLVASSQGDSSFQRWVRFSRQIGGLAKVDSGFDYPASFSDCSSLA
jgi:hypothetical protein